MVLVYIYLSEIELCVYYIYVTLLIRLNNLDSNCNNYSCHIIYY